MRCVDSLVIFRDPKGCTAAASRHHYKNSRNYSMKRWLLLSSLVFFSCDLLFKVNPEYCGETQICGEGLICGADLICIASPSITGITPAVGSPGGGTLITLSVQNLMPGLTAVVDGHPVATTALSASELQFTLPELMGACGS